MPAATIIIIGFLAVIAIGAALLMLPISSKAHTFTDIETSAFTAVSATCITGLTIVDTMTHWSTFGQIVILVMIQTGGLGFMTLALLTSLLIKRVITPRERLIAAQSLGLNTNEGTVRLVRLVLIGTFSAEGVGAAVLSTQFIPLFGVGDGIYRSIFHSISAFCNAGFDLMGDYSGAGTSMSFFRENYIVNITLILLIVTGGIGFIVWDDLYEHIKIQRRFSVYSRFVLIVTAILIFGGATLIFAFEYSNPATFAPLEGDKKVLASLFQSVTTRTAGFFSTDNTLLTENSKLICIMLMLIGGASGSTAGGIKVGTIGIAVYAVFSTAAGYADVTLFKRKISRANIMRAFAIVFLAVILALTCAFVITVTDGTEFIEAFYETASAMATVGLSLNITASLSTAAHILTMMLMFFGKVGILTVTYSIMLRVSQRKSAISYAETYFLIG